MFLLGCAACTAQKPQTDTRLGVAEAELRTARQRRIEAGGAATLPATPVEASGHICWILSVRKTSSGVAVSFSDSRRVLRLHPGGGPSEKFVDQEPVRAPAKAGFPVPVVTAVLGDMLLADTTLEDSCQMKVVLKEGKIGIEASASFHPPDIQAGTPNPTSLEFIAAE